MTDRPTSRCPSCDVVNGADAGFCSNCGIPIGASSASPAVVVASVSAGRSGPGTQYMVAAVAVAVVLLVGGTLFFLADGDERSESGAGDARTVETSATVADPSAGARTTQVVATVGSATVVLEPTSTPVLTTTTVAPTTSSSTSTSTTTSTSAPTTTTTTTTTVAAPPPPPPPPANAVTSGDADGLFRQYVSTAIARDYLGAWNLLSVTDQADYTRGYDQFVEFWQSVSFAEVRSTTPLAGNDSIQSLQIEMAYGQADGSPTSLEVIEADVNRRPDGTLQLFDYRFIRSI